MQIYPNHITGTYTKYKIGWPAGRLVHFSFHVNAMIHEGKFSSLFRTSDTSSLLATHASVIHL